MSWDQRGSQGAGWKGHPLQEDRCKALSAPQSSPVTCLLRLKMGVNRILSSLHEFLKSYVMAETKIITSRDVLLIKNTSETCIFFPQMSSFYWSSMWIQVYLYLFLSHTVWMWDLSSLSRDQTQGPAVEVEVLTSGSPGKSQRLYF